MLIVPKSCIDYVDWPAVPGDSGVQLLSLLDQLNESQWWPARELEQYQRRQLKVLLEHAVTTVPHYRATLGDCGNSIDELLTPERWRSLPLLSRTEVQGRMDALQSESPPTAHGRIHTLNTSGSTGRPVTLKTTDVYNALVGAFALRGMAWHQRDVKGKLAIIHLPQRYGMHGDRGERRSNWGWPTADAYSTGELVLFSIAAPFEDQLAWLKSEQPDYFLTIPSNLRALLDMSADTGFHPGRLREVTTVAEAVDAELRDLCLQVWGVPLVDTYSAQEAGSIAVQCPESRCYHVMSEGVLLEVLGDDGQPCKPGDIGRVVITPLHSFAMPLIRYELGDLAEVGEPCACGRGLPVLRQILGRTRDLWRLRDGRRFWPRLRRSRFTDVAPIRQHQFVQTGYGELEAHLVVQRPLTVHEEQQLTELFQSTLPAPFKVRFVYHDDIPRGPGGKYEYFRCEID